MDVLVIGAGPTGLTAATELARQGIFPDIVERRNEASPLSRAVGIMPESIDKLRACGAADAIEKEAMNILKISINHGGKELLGVDFNTALSNERHMLGLPQNRTEALIAEALKNYGVHVQYGNEVTAVKTTNEKATVSFSNNTTKTYDWVIAADGIRSIARTKLGIDYPGIDLDGEWSIADIDVKGYDPELVSIWIQDEIDNKGAFYMILPIETNRLRIVSSTPDTLSTLPIKLDIQNIRRTGTFNISIKQASTYKKGRVLLAGDAAHCHSPVGGRGMNLGIDDAVAAVKAIIKGTTDQYSNIRHAKGKAVLQDSEDARKTIMSTNLLTQLTTKGVLALIGHSNTLQKMLLKKLTTL